LVLVGTAVFLADRMGRRLVEPTRELAAAAHLLGEGDLNVRVSVADPPEFREVADAFNRLASRLEHLLAQEREEVANLSHRLRTPLTSLRLQAESIEDPGERQEILAQVDRVEAAVDRLIVASRSPGEDLSDQCNLSEVVSRRAAFWKVLADEQGREIKVTLGAMDVELGVAPEEVEAVVDALVGNVFSHTPPGTAFSIATGEDDNRPWIEVADEGPGFADLTLLHRGVSGRGSTGLGLDIVRRTAETTGGGLEVNDRPTGGAVVRVLFG
jgi:signal transduction histidine kinase